MSKNRNILLRLEDTLVLKGIALLLLLSHHLFYKNNGVYDDILLWKDHYLVQEIGIMSKVCVAIFVFLSGYGLAVSTEKKGGVLSPKNFYVSRFKKLFLNYWFIWLLFVPISYYCFGMTFEKAYQQHVVLQLATDIMGIHEFIFGSISYCYNPTWWFYSCIILLYMLFPLLYKWTKSDTVLMILGAMAFFFLPIPHLGFIRYYLLTFVLGIMFAIQKLPPPTERKTCVLIVCTCFIAARNFSPSPLFVDSLICVVMVQLYRVISISNPLKHALAFLGKHSMNIFLFHTFIYYFWFREYIYFTRMPIIIYLILLIVCIVISVMLEWVKKYTIYRFL